MAATEHAEVERGERDLLQKAAAILVDVVIARGEASFRSQEDALAQALAGAGRLATQGLLERHVEPEPDVVLVDGKRHRKVLVDGSARIGTPFGVISLPRALYRREGQRGVKGATTVGLLEKRAGIIDGMTPRLAELTTYYDASVPSRESEKLMDLAGLRGPRRATLENKAGSIGTELLGNLDAFLAEARADQPLPTAAAMITIGMDRVNVPYEEPNPGGEKSERTRQLRAKKPYQRREPEPVVRAFRGDFVGSVSIRDEHGELIGGYCYGLSHTEEPRRLADWLVADVVAAVRQNPSILVSVCQDGARELWPTTWEALKRAPELGAVKIRACVDFHHFSPRVRNVVSLLWDDDAVPEWKRRLLDEEGAVLALQDAVLQEAERRLDEMSSEQLEAIHDFQTYIQERTRIDGREDRRSELFDYAALRAEGLPIGSGPTEATAKSLAGVRMKRCGNRWSVPGASATLVCRGLILSAGRWERVWPQFANSKVAEVIPLPVQLDSKDVESMSAQQAA